MDSQPLTAPAAAPLSAEDETVGVSGRPRTAQLKGALKLVIWDLDEVIWRGVLSEEEVELDQERAQVVRTLNRRGIVNSICSKNDPDKARARLEREGLWEEFVFPSISWEPFTVAPPFLAKASSRPDSVTASEPTLLTTSAGRRPFCS